jgi:ABC-2 type transport system ATP-binding protein
MAHALLEVRCADPSRALDILRSLDGVHEVALFGAAIHLSVDDAEPAAQGVRDALARASIALESVQPIEPSLEDVFISVIRRADGGAAN